MQLRRGFRSSTAALVGSILCISACASGPEARKISLCEALGDIDRMSGQPIEITAEVQSDGWHVVFIEDPRCTDLTAQVRWSESPENDGDSDRLYAAIMEEPVGTAEKSIRITAIGRVSYETHQSMRARVFRAEKLLRLQVSKPRS